MNRILMALRSDVAFFSNIKLGFLNFWKILVEENYIKLSSLYSSMRIINYFSVYLFIIKNYLKNLF